MKLNEIGDGGHAPMLARKFLKLLSFLSHEVKEMALAYLVKTPGPFVSIGQATINYMTDGGHGNLLRLGHALANAAKLPVAFLGLGYVSMVLPVFGVPASMVVLTKAFGWFSYILYRIACNHPRYRSKVKALFPLEFLPDDLKKEVQQEKEKEAKQHDEPLKISPPPRFRPGLEELPKMENVSRR